GPATAGRSQAARLPAVFDGVVRVGPAAMGWARDTRTCRRPAARLGRRGRRVPGGSGRAGGRAAPVAHGGGGRAGRTARTRPRRRLSPAGRHLAALPGAAPDGVTGPAPRRLSRGALPQPRVAAPRPARVVKPPRSRRRASHDAALTAASRAARTFSFV